MKITNKCYPKIKLDNKNIFIAAPTRSGKGVGIVNPTLLDSMSNCVVYDLKPSQQTKSIYSSFEVFYVQPLTNTFFHVSQLEE